MEGPRIVLVGGGSLQWAPSLITDIANTPSLHGAELVLLDINPSRLPRVAAYVEHVAKLRDIPLTVQTTTDQQAALSGAEFVAVTITTGGLRSMRHDLEIPAQYGIFQPVVDGGPAGVSRALRNVPVLVGIARDMEQNCPEAWLLNLTNPMAQLCRAVTRETSIRTVGLCHEVTICRFFLSALLEVDFRAINPVVTGVNHFPVITQLDIDGRDGLAMLDDLISSPDEHGKELPYDLPDDMGWHTSGERRTKGALLDAMRIKLELFQRFGALPASNDRHLVEYFAGFSRQESSLIDRWGVRLTTIEMREQHEEQYSEDLDKRLAAETVSTMPSGEMVAPTIDALIRDRTRHLPLNLPNRGQCPDLPTGATVESICEVDGRGARGRDVATAPPFFAQQLRQVVAAHELTVEAALTGDRDTVLAAMLADPLASRIEYDSVKQMTSELLEATREWLPQFSSV